MPINSFTSNQGTQTALLTDNTGGTGGTLVPVMKVDISGQGTAGTLWSGNVGVTTGTITVLPNLPQGSINVTAGTIATLGTIGTLGLVNTVTTVTNLSNGTIQNSGTVTGVGVVSVLTKGTISLGSIGGIDANGVAQTGNPMSVGGTDSGGTVRTVLVNSAGAMSVTGASAGTFVNISTGTLTTGSISNVAMLNAGTISTLPNLPQGSINVTAGTIATLGTMGTLGLVNTVTTVTNLSNGTIQNSGTVTGVGTITNLGTVSAATVSSLPNLPGGTLTNLISGTINAATVVLNSGTINVGTFVMPSGTVNVGTFVNNGGSVTSQLNPLPNINVISNVGTSGTTAIGTLLGSVTVGVGTALYVASYTVTGVSGTPECTLAFGTQITGSQVVYHGLVPAGGGITVNKMYPHGYGTTHADLTYQINSGAGTISWSVDYFLHT